MYNLREAKKEDISTLKTLYYYFVLDMNQFEASDSIMDEEVLIWIETALSGEKSIIYVAEKDDVISGFVRLQHKERISGDENKIIHYAKLSDLYVLPEVRKKGIAKQLINASIHWAKERQLYDMILNVYEKNQAAHNLYKAFGFEDESNLSDSRIRMKYNFCE